MNPIITKVVGATKLSAQTSIVCSLIKLKQTIVYWKNQKVEFPSIVFTESSF